MKRKSYSQESQANFRRLCQIKAVDVKGTPEHPELDVTKITRAIVRKGIILVPPKTSVSLRIDVDVLDRSKSPGGGYQTRINAVLRAFDEAAL